MSAEKDLKAVLSVAEHLEVERNQLREQMNAKYPRIDNHGENVAYLYLCEAKAGDSKKQIPVSVNGELALVVDLNDKGQVLGVEFLDADTQLGAPQ